MNPLVRMKLTLITLFAAISAHAAPIRILYLDADG